MKCHTILVFTVCQSTRLGVSDLQRVNGNKGLEIDVKGQIRVTNWTRPFPNLVLLGCIFHCIHTMRSEVPDLF